MAYINQEKKAEIAKALKEALKEFAGPIKYTLSIDRYSTINFNLKSSPYDLLAGSYRDDYLQVSQYHLRKQFQSDELRLMETIFKCLNAGNWDRSDSMIDYFDVGWYSYVNIGSWKSPYICTSKPKEQKAA